MKSRDVIAESSELNDLKELRLVYPLWQAVAILIGRTIGRPAQWKADLHAFALSFLPAVVAFMVTLVAYGAIGTTFWISMGLYAIMVFMVALFKYHSTKDDNKVLDGIFLRIIGLVSAAFLLAAVGIVLGTLSGDPVIQGLVALIAAAVTAIISQKALALDPEYLAKAKKSPPLFSHREKRVWEKAAAVYGILGVAALPRLLPENILNIPWQVGVLFAGGAMLAGVIVALFYWRRSIGAVLSALFYRLYRRFKLLKLFELLKRSWLFR